MLGFKGAQPTAERKPDDNHDVARLFFDTFSKRVEKVEEQLLTMSSEFESLKLSSEKGQISDLVLLERIQKSEGKIRDTLAVIKSAVEDAVRVRGESGQQSTETETLARAHISATISPDLTIASHVLSPTGELGSLSSITTPTELQVLTLLASEGPKSAPEIGRAVGRSREHTARLMKKLYEEGYIRRDQTRIPFRYAIVDRLKQTAKKEEAKAEGKEPISVPQT